MRISSEGRKGGAVPQRVDSVGLAAAITTSVVWGMTGIFVRLLPAVSPLYITSLRFLVALVVALPFALLAPRLRGHLVAAVRGRAGWWLALHLVLYYATAVAAYQLAPVAEVALFLSTAPLFALGIGVLRGDAARRHEIQGALLALVGVAIVLAPGFTAQGGAEGRLLGDVLGLASALTAAIYSDAYRRYGAAGRAPNGLAVTVLAFTVGGGLLVAWSVATGAASAAVFEGPALAYLIALSLGSTLLPSLLTAYASQRLPAVLTTTIRLLIPVCAAVFALWFLHEPPSSTVIPGGVLVLGGIVWMVRGGRGGT